ncbi:MULTISPECIES: type III secretion protein [Pseudomonas]|jgi:hypothetical protein|uniref:Type III secretion protein n=1 Tax=Pseudomonas wuhanensis TaxID=2954098 RepID=A0ABY9GLB4_9PSED|nr:MULTISPECIES: type III secretion protein [unclassified Pseudomonas]WLI10718.1 type III secretion protein [Pseudomonas sp. FP603]WLI16534.1 type III secretion protein [Pseudomonas sp. FP607]
MLNFEHLRNSLDRSMNQANDDFDDAAAAASESGTIEDMQAFTEAARGVASASFVMTEAQRADNGITKAILDGIQ